ncbi:MAG: hypothetical protein Q8R60_15065 [Mycobacteriales bacterium]|nr:hypothetical protein [Mycobacteriales bacterium]
MRGGRRALLAAVVAAVLGAGPSNAEPPDPPVVDDPTGTVTTIIRLPGTPGKAPGAPTSSDDGVSLDPCSYRYDPSGMVAENFDFSRPDAPTLEQIEAGEIRWYAVACPGQAEYPIFTAQGQPAPGPPPPSPGQLAANAREVMQLPFPEVRHNPTDAGLVNLDTWLWLGDSSWQVQSNALSLRGTTVTVVAKPTRVEWVTGDGIRVSCAGQGRPYDESVPADQQSTYCSHTYRRSSAGQPNSAYAGSATSSWEIRWVGSAPGGGVQQGVLPPLELTTAFNLRVQEVQDLVTRSR